MERNEAEHYRDVDFKIIEEGSSYQVQEVYETPDGERHVSIVNKNVVVHDNTPLVTGHSLGYNGSYSYSRTTSRGESAIADGFLGYEHGSDDLGFGR